MDQQSDSAKSKNRNKIFNDPIHGLIELHPLLVSVIQTPYFHRLKSIKQLGTLYFVYPAASHNRFEHSIGTCHLAGQLARQLKRDWNKQRKDADPPEITDEDVLSIELAALCHDLGHGPFSHHFDDVFLKRLEEDNYFENETEEKPVLRHEYRSGLMLDALVEIDSVEKELDAAKIDIEFVKFLIDPPKNDWETKFREKFRNKGTFLAEIVSNPRSGVDVDKFDYLARDCYQAGLKNSFDHKRFMKFMQVRKAHDGSFQICVRDKETSNLCELFHVRSRIHSRVCYHNAGKVIDVMLSDAMEKVKEKIIKKSPTDKWVLTLFAELTDDIFDSILHGKYGKNAKSGEKVSAKDIIERIVKRELYRRLGDPISSKHVGSEKAFKRNLLQKVQEKAEERGLDPKKVRVEATVQRFGQGKEKELKNFLVYGKGQEEAKPANKDLLEMTIPKSPQLTKIVIMYTDASIELADENELHKCAENFVNPPPKADQSNTP